MQTIHRSFHGFACEQFHISENVIDRYSTLVHQFPHLSRCNWSLSCSTGFPVKSRQSRARYVDVVYRRPRTPAAYKSPLLCVAGIALASETSYLQPFYCSFLQSLLISLSIREKWSRARLRLCVFNLLHRRRRNLLLSIFFDYGYSRCC